MIRAIALASVVVTLALPAAAQTPSPPSPPPPPAQPAPPSQPGICCCRVWSHGWQYSWRPNAECGTRNGTCVTPDHC